MQRIKDIIYRGQEVVIIKDTDGSYIADVREDKTNGDIIAGWDCLKSEEEAILTAKQFIDENQPKGGASRD
jgi:hypothetical protein